MKKIALILSVLFFAQIAQAQIVYGNAVQLQGRTLSPNAPNDGQVVGWNETFAAWLPVDASTASGSVTSVSSGAGLLGGPITTAGTLSVDVGTAANKIVQLTSAAKYPAVDGSLITNLNFANKALSNLTATSINQNLKPNSNAAFDLGEASTKWNILFAGTANDASNLTSVHFLSRQLMNGPTVALGWGGMSTQSSGQFIKTNGSGAGSWSNIDQLQGVSIATTSPTSSQVLTYNSSLAKWHPETPASGNLPSAFIASNSYAQDIGIGPVLILDSDTQTQVLYGSSDTAGTTRDSGVVVLESGAITNLASSHDSGETDLYSGNTTLGNSGQVYVSSGFSASGNSGPIIINSGGATLGNSGNITLSPGSAGGTRGKIQFDDGSAIVGYVWTATSTDGSGTYQAATGGGLASDWNSSNSYSSDLLGTGPAIYGDSTAASTFGFQTTDLATQNATTAAFIIAPGSAMDTTSTSGVAGAILITSGSNYSTAFSGSHVGVGAVSIYPGFASSGKAGNLVLAGGSAGGDADVAGGNVQITTNVGGLAGGGLISLTTADYAGTSTASPNTGTISITSGNNGADADHPFTGIIHIATGQIGGDSANGISGELQFETGNATDLTATSSSGNMFFRTGNSPYQSGNVEITTGPGTVVDNAWSGTVFITTGDVTGTAQSGDIAFTPGAIGVGGSRGRILAAAHVVTSDGTGGMPAVSSCGSGATNVGNDVAGRITTGTTVTGCVLTFNQPWGTAPVCVVQDDTSGGTIDAVITLTTLSIASGPSDGDVLSYICFGYL